MSDKKEPIRILQYIGSLETGGSQSMIMNIYRNIDRSKVQFDFVVDRKDKNDLFYKDEIESLGGKVYVFDEYFKGYNYFAFARQWREFFKKHPEYKIIHCHVRSVASIVLKVAKRNGLVTICHSHNTSNGKGIKAVAKKMLQSKIHKNCDYYFACSRDAAEWLYGDKIAKSDKCIILNNAIEVDKYRFNQNYRDEIRKKYGISDDVYLIGYVGRFEKQKNHEFIFRLIEGAKDDNGTIFMLCGDGTLKANFQKRIEEVGLKDKVIFVSGNTEIYKYYDAFDYFVLPSLYEGLGMVLIEAQFSGLTCLVSPNIPAEAKISKNFIVRDLLEQEWEKEIVKKKVNQKRGEVKLLDNARRFDILPVAREMQRFYLEKGDGMTKQKKTFVFITNTDYVKGNLTGGHRRFLELVNGLSIENEVILISKKIPGLKKDNMKFIEIKENKHRFLPAHIYKILTIYKVLRRERKNIQYDYAISFGPVDTISYKISGYNNIVMLLREDFVGYRKVVGMSAVKMEYFKLLERYAVKNSQKIIVQCEDDKEALIKRLGEKVRQKIYIQPNNINASWISESKIERKKRDDGVVRIAFIGNFSDNRKGHSLLLPAVAKIIDEGYNIELYVVGDGRQLEKYRDEYGNYQRMKFLGRVKNVGEILSKSDFVVVPSLMDSCPNTVLEGINIGVPVYGTDIGGIKEILQDKNYLFEPDVDSIYTFIKKKIDIGDYASDGIKQKVIKRRLTFDWSDKIQNIIDGKNGANR
ncbi:glycosyltransferase [Candidatus Saccharibacteria bacterium]|nr:glycosyltransferase [Candidatus Saccharibacteria bacterium]